jgi:hypothetical protein
MMDGVELHKRPPNESLSPQMQARHSSGRFSGTSSPLPSSGGHHARVLLIMCQCGTYAFILAGAARVRGAQTKVAGHTCPPPRAAHLPSLVTRYESATGACGNAMGAVLRGLRPCWLVSRARWPNVAVSHDRP